MKGRRFYPPTGLPARPTTDSSKESIFNILGNHFDFTKIKALDLFAGTGSISYELASRGCRHITAVENDRQCCRFIQRMADELAFRCIEIVQQDVFVFLRNCDEEYDVIFADPPYTEKNLDELLHIVFENRLLGEGGWFILEHEPKISFEKHPRFRQQRRYGSSVFSFFA